jgi:hypothetical protein
LKIVTINQICLKAFVCKFANIPTSIVIHDFSFKINSLHFHYNIIDIQNNKLFLIPFIFFVGLEELDSLENLFATFPLAIMIRNKKALENFK